MQFVCSKCGKGIYDTNVTKMGKAGLACGSCGHKRVKFFGTKNVAKDIANAP